MHNLEPQKYTRNVKDKKIILNQIQELLTLQWDFKYVGKVQVMQYMHSSCKYNGNFKEV